MAARAFGFNQIEGTERGEGEKARVSVQGVGGLFIHHEETADGRRVEILAMDATRAYTALM